MSEQEWADRVATPESQRAKFRGTVQSMRAIFAAAMNDPLALDPIPTRYRGIAMRSRLEADFAYYLDSSDVLWTYEPRKFGPEGARYLPDFELHLGPRPCFLELKPTITEARAAAKRIKIIWETEPNAFLIVASAEECRFWGASKGEPWTPWVERWHH